MTEPEPRVLHLDLAGERARLGDEPLRLTPKAFALLRHLVLHRDRLVTKAELLAALWPATAVSDGVLTTTIREIRRALGEGSRSGGSIETLHRRGYRFTGHADVAGESAPSAAAIIGREPELARLDRCLATADAGTRQIVFVTGEAGIGKTALVDAFIARAGARPGVRVVRGQCVERYGAAEAYLPWLDALGDLCRQPGREASVELLRRVAPLWLVQLPAFMDPAERAALHREVSGAPAERMLRELCEALEALAADHPLVVVLEDLHWGDRSSLELLASIARRRQRTRLLVVGTFRPLDAVQAGHPLVGIQRDLQMHRHCIDLPLPFLSRDAVDTYLAARFPGLPEDVAPIVHRRTEGNALFMVNTADYLADCALVVANDGRWELRGEMRAIEAAVPDSLRAIIGRQLERMGGADGRLLEAASVAGVEFADAALAAALGASLEDVSRECAALAQRGAFLEAGVEEDWPDGTATRRYRFIHALYPEVLYERIAPSARVRMHGAVAQRLEAGYRDGAGAIAAELAAHFERARDPARAVAHLAVAAGNAAQRLAYVEAIGELNRALDLLATLPEDAARKKQELAIRIALAPPLMVTFGYAAPEVDAVYERAEALCRDVGDTRQSFSVLIGRSAPSLLLARTERAKALAERAVALARAQNDPRYLTQAETAIGLALVWRGEFVPAAEHLERSRIASEAVTQWPPAFRMVHDPGVAGRSYAAWAQWMLGFPERAKREAAAAVANAQELSHPFSLAFALVFAAFVHQARREIDATRERADAAIALCTEHGFAMYLAVATVFRGWTIAEAGAVDEGLAVMEEGLAAYAATGALLVRPFYLALIGEACARSGDVARARALLLDGLAGAARTGERVYEAELGRLLGELARETDAAEAEARFAEALRVARVQRARSLELRVATSLARLRRSQGRSEEGASLLSAAYDAFSEGFDTPDLRDGARLLAELREARVATAP
jgi:DNA-binding winged helix-turn-helix (wHTH) protein/predicted ATPase